MSILSMTGCGRGEASADGWRVEVDLTCVNRKQLDLATSLPRTLADLEADLLSRVRQRISRGRVSLRVTLNSTGGASARTLVLEEGLAREALSRLRVLADTLGLAAPTSLSELNLVAPFARVEESIPPAESAVQLVQLALAQALDRLQEMRISEGNSLRLDVLDRLHELERTVAGIAARAPASVNLLRDQLLRRLKEAGLPLDMGDERIAREIALHADRCDVSEELTRLASHFQQFRASVSATESAGRTLDFLCQEIFREINTLGSKTADHLASADIIRMKTELERIREQVQNVE